MNDDVLSTDSIYKCGRRTYFQKTIPKFTFPKLPKIWLTLFGHFLPKKKILLQIDSKWSETCKKDKTGNVKIFLVVGAGNWQLSYFTSREC